MTVSIRSMDLQRIKDMEPGNIWMQSDGWDRVRFTGERFLSHWLRIAQINEQMSGGFHYADCRLLGAVRQYARQRDYDAAICKNGKYGDAKSCVRAYPDAGGGGIWRQYQFDRRIESTAGSWQRADDHGPSGGQHASDAGAVCIFSGKVEWRKYDCDQTVYRWAGI